MRKGQNQETLWSNGLLHEEGFQEQQEALGLATPKETLMF